MLYDIPSPPLNEQSVVIEERYFTDLVRNARDADSMAEVYAQQVPNLRSSEKTRPGSSRMAKLKRTGLIGCFNGTGVNSSNYKGIITGEQKE